MRAVVLFAVAGCVSAGRPTGDWLVSRDTGKADLRAHLVAPVAYGGLLFDDDACARRFPEPATLADDQLDAFAGCLASLGLRAVEDRRARTPNARLVEYGPGLEVEVAVDPVTAHIVAIGFAGHAVGDRRPMLGDHALGALRASGGDDEPADAWVRICIDDKGALATIHPVEIAKEEDLAIAAHDFSLWKLRPFVFAGRARPACALVDLAGSRTADAKLPRALPADALFVHHLDRADGVSSEAEFRRAGPNPLRARVLACIDASGAVTSVELEAASGVPAHDASALAEIRGRRYRPLVAQVPACTVDTVFFKR